MILQSDWYYQHSSAHTKACPNTPPETFPPPLFSARARINIWFGSARRGAAGWTYTCGQIRRNPLIRSMLIRLDSSVHMVQRRGRASGIPGGRSERERWPGYRKSLQRCSPATMRRETRQKYGCMRGRGGEGGGGRERERQEGREGAVCSLCCRRLQCCGYYLQE